MTLRPMARRRGPQHRAPGRNAAPLRGEGGARSHSRFAPPPVHVMPHPLKYSVLPFLRRRCGRPLRCWGFRGNFKKFDRETPIFSIDWKTPTFFSRIADPKPPSASCCRWKRTSARRRGCCSSAVRIGLGRIVTLYDCPSTLYQIH